MSRIRCHAAAPDDRLRQWEYTRLASVGSCKPATEGPAAAKIARKAWRQTQISVAIHSSSSVKGAYWRGRATGHGPVAMLQPDMPGLQALTAARRECKALQWLTGRRWQDLRPSPAMARWSSSKKSPSCSTVCFPHMSAASRSCMLLTAVFGKTAAHLLGKLPGRGTGLPWL